MIRKERVRARVDVMRRFLQDARASVVSADGAVLCFHGVLWAGTELIGRVERGVVILPKVPAAWIAAQVQTLEKMAIAAGKKVRYENYGTYCIRELGKDLSYGMKQKERLKSRKSVMCRFLRDEQANTVSADGVVNCFQGVIWAGQDLIGRIECGVVILPRVPVSWVAAQVRVLEKEARAVGKKVRYESYSACRGGDA